MKNSKIFTFVLLLLVLLLGVASIYMYMKWKDDKGKLDTMTAEFEGLEGQYTAVTGELKNNQESESAEKLSSKYDTFTLLGKCGIGLSYPDEGNRYDPFSAEGVIDGRNRAWRLTTNVIEKNSASDKNIMVGGTSYELILRNDNEASGYISSMIFIQCKDNKEGYTADTFTKAYFDYVNKANKKTVADLVAIGENYDLKDYTVKTLEVAKLSGIDVNKVLVEKVAIAHAYPENGYMFVYKDKVYYIYTIGASTEKQVTRATAAILKSIYLY